MIAVSPLHVSVVSGMLPALCSGLMGADLIHTKPPEWQVEGWLNSPPLKLSDLKGKVVLIRWWTAPGCPYCVATAPALNEFHEHYSDRGLVVVGLYHHKSSVPLSSGHVAKQVDRLGIKFPVAIDLDWRTLNQWWLDGGDRDFTSVSFLIDKTGRIRHIHPGGEYPKDTDDHRVMKVRIEELLKEP